MRLITSGNWNFDDSRQINWHLIFKYKNAVPTDSIVKVPTKLP